MPDQSQQLTIPLKPATAFSDIVDQLAFDPCATDCPWFSNLEGTNICGSCCDRKGQTCAAYAGLPNGCGSGDGVVTAIVQYLIRNFGPYGTLQAFAAFCIIHDIGYLTPNNLQAECDSELHDQTVSICKLAFPVPAATTCQSGRPQDPAGPTCYGNSQERCIQDADNIYAVLQRVGFSAYNDAQLVERN